MKVLLAIALFKLFNFFGGNWDIQWHVAIGRDSLWIPPHLMVMVAFTSGSLITLGAIAYETILARRGAPLEGVAGTGPFRAPPAYFGILFGYAGALLSAVFDEIWHETFGIDATLWSPPHLCIMASTTLVDISLLVGIAMAARRLNARLTLRSPIFWGMVLAGAYGLESVNFQMSEAFIAGYRAGGAGLLGILFPVLVGALFPFSLILNLRLSRLFWIAAPVFALTLALQLTGTGIASLGFAVFKPVSVVEEFVRLHPESTTAKAREFARLTGFTGLIGFQQAWMIGLSALPMALVALLEAWPWARRKVLVAAPVYSASLVVVSCLWFQRIPVMRAYGVSWATVILGACLSAAAGTITGWIGMRLADRAGQYTIHSRPSRELSPGG